jgi:hypothetical protein
MHYITGTQFAVNSQLRARLTLTGETLTLGTVYQILKIEKDNNHYIYTFVDAQRKRVKVQFNSCREADKMIGVYRGERVPDYDTYYGNNTDL